MNKYEKCITPISEEDFSNVVNIKFDNILDGFNKYENKILTKKENTIFQETEEEFIKFITSCYLINKENSDYPLIIDFYLKNLNENDLNKLKRMLSNEDKIILEYIEKYIIASNTKYFIIKDIDIIPFFVRLSTREIFFITFYFTQNQITIWGNYNLKFPIFYKDIFSFDKYIEISKENNLEIL